MSKFWLVAKNEYRKRAGQRSFLIGTLLIPVAIVVLFALTIFIVERGTNREPIGFVDHSGLLAGKPAPELEEDAVDIFEYPDEQAAQGALEAKEIQAYYVIPESYPEVLEVDLYYWDDWPAGEVQRDFDDYIRAILLPEGLNPIQTRLLEEARQAGCRTVDGVAMFVYQGARQFELWTGKPAPLHVMRDAVVERLKR